MSRTSTHIITPDMGTMEVTRPDGRVMTSITVHTGMVALTVTSGFFSRGVRVSPVGPEFMTASLTDQNGTTYDLTDTRPGIRQPVRPARFYG